MQLVLVNPVLIGLELLGSSRGGPGGVLGTLRRIGYQVGTQPLHRLTPHPLTPHTHFAWTPFP